MNTISLTDTPHSCQIPPAEFREHFNAYLNHILRGRAAAKVRLVLE